MATIRAMSPFKVTVASCITLLSVVFSSAATAETARVTDPAGDGQDGRLFDITAFKVDNGDFMVTTRVTFRRVLAPGEVYVTYLLRGTRGEAGATVITKLRPRGVVNRFWTRDGVVECRGLTVKWDFKADLVDIAFPSRCLEHGNYGAFKAQVIVERGGASDADLAPKDADGNWSWTRWLGRG